MKKQSFDSANGDDSIDEYIFHFWDAERLLIRNIKAKTLKVVTSDDNGIHVTARWFTKKNLSLYVTTDGFLNVEGTYRPGGKHALVLADGEYSAYSPSSIQLTQSLDCVEMIIAVPTGIEVIAAWIEANSIKFLTMLRDSHIWCLRSPDPVVFTRISDSVLVVEDNNAYEIEQASGIFDISIYSDVPTQRNRPYSRIKIGNPSERINLLTLRMPGEGECYIGSAVTIIKGMLAGILDTTAPAVEYLKKFASSRYFTHP